MQKMSRGLIGYLLDEDEHKDLFAMVNMKERCTTHSDLLKPSKVIKDFKHDKKTWVHPWGFKKGTNEPTRCIILSHANGV
jgi:hypothetical protein